jgi:shikimate dehydrogenase
VLGRPIEHSLSPVLHRAAYAELGLNWRYDAIDCGVAELGHVLAERADWAGFSATMPLKRALLDVADEVRAVAAAVGAANTLVPSAGGGWAADNTDAAGLATALEAGSGRVGPAESVALLGAGGTAQAALAALASLHVNRCMLVVRDPARAAEAVASARRLKVAVSIVAWDDADRALDADVVISTLPAHAADVLAARRWRPSQTVLDVIYDGWPTRLAQAVAGAGATVISGAELLLQQAALQVELMTACQAPRAAMRAALRRAVPGSGI